MNKELRFENFKLKANILHNNFYKYIKESYINARVDMKIICPIHGLFKQTPGNHLANHGCRKCGIIKGGNHKYNTESFIEHVQSIHNFKYEYPNTKYEHPHKNVYINCIKHGEFEQSPSRHISGQGCPKCVNVISKPEIEIQEFLKQQGYSILTNKKSIIKPFELDIYIPSLNKAIEFNGFYWHYYENKFVAGKHGKKSNLCREKGIKLLHIREDLWLKDKEKMKNIIIKFLNI